LNTANGRSSLYSNTTGDYNTANGAESLSLNTTGNYNTANGHSSLLINTTGSSNTTNGASSLYSNTTGFYNTANGYASLYSNTTGSNRTGIGNSANSLGTDYDNSTSLGYDGDPTAANTIHLGNSSVTSIKGQVGFTTYSDARFKTSVSNDEVRGLEFITKLNPVTYNYDIDAYAKWKETNYGEIDSSEWDSKYDIEKIRFSGFIAQEVEATAKEIGYDFSGVDAPKNDKDFYGLRYAEFVMPLVKAVQEQQDLIEELQISNDDLKEQISNLQNEKDEELRAIKGQLQQVMSLLELKAKVGE
jgi:hypothetical protein